MDVLSIIKSELQDKDWDSYTKARYLYLRSCELFTYDPRYVHADLKMQEKIRNHVIDLKNVEDNRVICGTWASEVYLPLLQTFNIDGYLVGENRGHQYVKFKVDDDIIRADACISSDLTRVKMNNNTINFYPETKHYQYEEQLRQMDQMIGYIDSDYTRKNIIETSKSLEQEFLEENGVRGYQADEFLIYKMYKIKEMLEQYPNLKYYSDYQFCLSYLGDKLLTDNEKINVSELELYNPSKPSWNFAQLLSVELSSDMLYFILNHVDDKYCFYEITESDAKQYMKSYGVIESKFIK